ncbi:MAG: nucleotidyltransferase domain-containing protein [Chloroflexi bacterium]|nr:nucleotidyltransferase domain-containing protein [Chloroflexota bacterium]
MPMRVGFTKFRQEMLERELEAIEAMLPTLGVEKVILTGDMVSGVYTPESRIDLIVVQKTDLRFGRRADFFSWHLNSGVAVDTQVYTPEEFETCQESIPGLKVAIERGRVLFDA